MSDLIPIEVAENRIFLLRGQKVMLDVDLARLYGVPTSRLNEQVKRNMDRFPEDFMFSLKREEILRISQIAISSQGGEYDKLKFSKNVNAFTQEGVAMLSSVLSSKRAVQVNIAIMRAFVRLNRILASHIEVSKKLKELEQKTLKNEKDIQVVIDVIRELTSVKPSAIGFKVD